MPKIVDHEARRAEIAQAACRAIAARGFATVTMADIAAEAGCTTGMLVHYFRRKREILVAALLAVMERMRARLGDPVTGTARPDLASVLAESLPVDDTRRAEGAVWMGFWSGVGSNPDLAALGPAVIDRAHDLYDTILRSAWPAYLGWPAAVRRDVREAVSVALNGLICNAMSSPHRWPASAQRRHLALHLEMIRAWAVDQPGAGSANSGSRVRAAASSH